METPISDQERNHPDLSFDKIRKDKRMKMTEITPLNQKITFVISFLSPQIINPKIHY